MIRDTFVRAFHSREINGKHWRAISWTTAASCCATIELVSKGIIPNKGFVGQEDIDYKDLTGTSFGKMFQMELLSHTGNIYKEYHIGYIQIQIWLLRVLI